MNNLVLGNKYKTEVIDLGSEGQGICKIDGFSVFVDNVLPLEEIEIEITKINANFGFAKVVNIIKNSPYRVNANCSSAKKCGGCDFQNMNYEFQLKHKRNAVLQCLKRIGKVENPQVNETIGMENPFNYRNKVQYPVSEINKKPVIGFYEKKTHNVIDIDECCISDNSHNEILGIIKNHMIENDIWAYNEAFHRGTVRHIVIRNSYSTKEIMICIVVKNHKKTADLKFLINKCDDLVKKLKKVENVKSIILNENNEKTGIIMGRKTEPVFGKEYINDFIGDIKFNISALSFFQVNTFQANKLYEKVLEYSSLTGNETVLDLYCGIGTITLFMAKHAKSVIGVEISISAIKDAIKNKAANKIENATFYSAPAEKKAVELFNSGVTPEVVILDPPRKGCDKQLIDALVEVKSEKIVYVSCNPATLARDVALLLEGGYEFVEATPFDMFCWSVHVETVVLLKKKD